MNEFLFGKTVAINKYVIRVSAQIVEALLNFSSYHSQSYVCSFRPYAEDHGSIIHSLKNWCFFNNCPQKYIANNVRGNFTYTSLDKIQLLRLLSSTWIQYFIFSVKSLINNFLYHLHRKVFKPTWQILVKMISLIAGTVNNKLIKTWWKTTKYFIIV